jgi:hypothetical protein
MPAGSKAASPESLVNSSGRGNEDAGRVAMPKAIYLVARIDGDIGNTHSSDMQIVSREVA